MQRRNRSRPILNRAKRADQHSIKPDFLNALALRRQDIPGASASSSNGATSPSSISRTSPRALSPRSVWARCGFPMSATAIAFLSATAIAFLSPTRAFMASRSHPSVSIIISTSAIGKSSLGQRPPRDWERPSLEGDRRRGTSRKRQFLGVGAGTASFGFAIPKPRMRALWIGAWTDAACSFGFLRSTGAIRTVSSTERPHFGRAALQSWSARLRGSTFSKLLSKSVARLSIDGRELWRVAIRLKRTIIAPSPPNFDRHSRESGNPEGWETPFARPPPPGFWTLTAASA